MVRFYSGHIVSIYYVSEGATEGTTPTSATYLNLAHKAEIEWRQAPGHNPVRLSGRVDYAGQGKGVENPIVTVSLESPSQGSGKAFIKNFSSSDTSFTLLAMEDAASDVVFARITGCKVKRITPSVEIYPDGTPVRLTAEIWGWDIVFTQSGGVPTFETAPATILNYTNVVVKRNTVTITDWWNFEFTIENDLKRNRNDQGVTTGITRLTREVTGTWMRSANDGTDVGSTELNEAKNATDVDLEIALVSDLYQFVDCKYTEAAIRASNEEIIGKRMDFRATSLVIA